MQVYRSASYLPSGGGGNNEQRHHFLSATPNNGYPESFSALLELLDNQRFARGVPPDREQLGAVMVRRLKSELPPRWEGTPRFPERSLEALESGREDRS